MTDDEKRQQKAMLLLEHQEAEDNLAHLRERATRMRTQISEVCNWLQGHAEGSKYADAIVIARQDANLRASLGTYREIMNFDALVKLVDEIIAAKNTVRELEQRKMQLGLK